MSGTVMTEQTGETGEVINKSHTHTPSCTSAKSLTGSETRCSSLGLGRAVDSHTGQQADREQSAGLLRSNLHPPPQHQQQRRR